MTIEQKELLLEITKWHIKEFNNRMVDHWSSENYRIDDECSDVIRMLEKEYTAQYGKLPEWKHIDDVLSASQQLKNGGY